MKLFCLWLLLAAAFVNVGRSQTASPSPTPTPRAGDDEVVKISTNLVQIDVTVTDGKGKIITGLKPEDFEIYENGQKQKISNFSFVAAPSSESVNTSKSQPATKDAVPVPTASLRPSSVRRTIALVVDDLSLSFESTYQVRRALKKFVDEQMQDGDLVAIIRTGAGIGALQQFTSDKRQLYAAIEKVKWNSQGNGKIGAFAPIEPSLLEQRKASGDPTVSDEDIQAERNQTNARDDFRSGIFASGTLGALKYIVTGMSELPGRKSVILLSEGFRMLERDEDGISSTGRVYDFLKDLVDTANRASVVFYTIDARGLQYTGPTAADDIVDTSPQSLQQKSSDRSDELFETQSTLKFLANETGGFAVVNNNDIAGGVRRVINDQSYYLVGYEPDSETFDPEKRRFNKLEVKVTRPGVHVRYRSGFFNLVDKNVAAAPKEQTPAQQLNTALMSPFSVNGLSLHLNALFANNEKEGSFVRSLIHVPASELKFVDQPDGSKKAVFDVLAASFGDNGQVVDQIGRSYTLTAKQDVYQKLIEQGFVYHFTFPVKKPGAYQYRIAIRDEQSGAVGSASQFIEVPNLKKNRLTLSSIVLERLSMDEWQKQATASGPPESTTSLSDTALRQIKNNSVLRYGFEIYNARPSASGKSDLTAKIRLINDSKVVFDGKTNPIPDQPEGDTKHLGFSGGVSLGSQLPAGDYILQVIVTDNSAPVKSNIATQYIEFEVIPH